MEKVIESVHKKRMGEKKLKRNEKKKIKIPLA